MFEECLYFNTNALARTVTKIWSESYKAFGLSPPHAFLLRAVLAQPGISPRDLASILDLSRSTVTRFLDNLEARGYLERSPAGNDGRELSVNPTEKALAIHEALETTGAKLTQHMSEQFGQLEISELIKELRKIRKQIDN